MAGKPLYLMAFESQDGPVPIRDPKALHVSTDEEYPEVVSWNTSYEYGMGFVYRDNIDEDEDLNYNYRVQRTNDNIISVYATFEVPSYEFISIPGVSDSWQSRRGYRLQLSSNVFDVEKNYEFLNIIASAHYEKFNSNSIDPVTRKPYDQVSVPLHVMQSSNIIKNTEFNRGIFTPSIWTQRRAVYTSVNEQVTWLTPNDVVPSWNNSSYKQIAPSLKFYVQVVVRELDG